MVRTVFTRKSFHKIYGEPTEGSYGEMLLLKQHYRDMENANPDPEKMPEWVKGEKGIRKWKMLIFNTVFLQKTLETFGELHCEYCGKKELHIYHWNQKGPRINVATADHFIPRFLDDTLMFEESNLFVSCERCNTNKGHKIWSKDRINYPYNRNGI